MKIFCRILCWFAMAASAEVMAQPAKPLTHAGTASSATRYFQVTLVLRFSASPEGPPAPGTQSITTELAVSGNRPGSSKTRMGSQVPIITGGKTQLIDVGTNFDCDNVHVERDGLALHFLLETTRVGNMIRTKDAEGVEVEEPIISKRTIELTVKLPLDSAKTVFDSTVGVPGHQLKQMAPLSPLQVDAKSAIAQQGGMQVEMTAKELK